VGGDRGLRRNKEMEFGTWWMILVLSNIQGRGKVLTDFSQVY